ncbi:MAG TPA: type II toxin-antitoxin system VapC family toxin [Vicinamibacterales bacterium]|nr:type II toxin-antitoxin system VapC family toxin [Vicinamibacterales bacterium]
MKFWDTSALVPLVVDETATPAMRALIERDPDVIVWMLTSVELLSTIGRLGRLSAGLADLLPGVRHDVMDLFQRWAAVTHVEGVRRRAERLVGVHPLSAADAMQLGAALMVAADQPETLDFVTLDRNLARAAQLEGFRVVRD